MTGTVWVRCTSTAPAASNTGITSGQNYTGYWRLGGDNADLTGSLDEAAVYPSQLSAARLSAHYNAGTAAASLATYTAAILPDAPGALWHLDDTPLTAYRGNAFSTTMVDSSGNSRNGVYAYVNPQAGYRRCGRTDRSRAGGQHSGRVAGAGVGYDPVAYTNPQICSLEIWFRTTSTTGGKLLGFGNSQSGSSSSFDLQIYLRDDGRVAFGIYNSTTVTVTSPAGRTARTDPRLVRVVHRWVQAAA